MPLVEIESEPTQRPDVASLEPAPSGLVELGPDEAASTTAPDYFTQWIGPRPTSDLRTLKNGSDYIRLQETNARGRAGFFESIAPDESAVPFAGSVLDAVRVGKLVVTAKRLTNGDTVSDQDLLDMNLFLAESDREANAKWTGKLGKGIKDLVTFGAEIAGTALAVGSLAGAAPGVAAEVEAIAARGAVKVGTLQAKRMAFEVLQKRVEKKVINVAESIVGKRVAKRLGTSATEAAVRTEAAQTVASSFLAKTAAGLAGVVYAGATTAAVKQGTQLALTGGETAGANERQLISTLTGKPEAYSKSLMYDMGDQFIEYSTEFTGAKMAGAVGDVAKKFGVKLPGRDFGIRLKDRIERTMGWNIVNVNKGIAPAAAASRAAADATRTKWLAATGAYVGAIAMRDGVNVDTAIRWAKNAGYNGIAEEWAEERLGGFLRGLTGIEGDEAGLRNAVDKMIPSLEDGLVEVATFATPIAMITGLHGLQQSKWAGGEGLDKLARDTNRMITLLKKQDTAVEKFGTAERDELATLVQDHAKFYGQARNKNLAGKVLDMLESVATMSFSASEFGSLDRGLAAANIQPIIKTWSEARESYKKMAKAEKPSLQDAELDAMADKKLQPFLRRFADSWRQTLSVRALPSAGVTEDRAKELLDTAVAEGRVKFIKIGENRIPVHEEENFSAPSEELRAVIKDLNVFRLQKGQSPLSLSAYSMDMSAEEYLNATSDLTSDENFDLMVRMNFGRLGSDNTWKEWRKVTADTRKLTQQIEAGLPVVGMTVGVVSNKDQALPDRMTKVLKVLDNGRIVVDGMAANEDSIGPDNYRISDGLQLEFGRGSLSMGTRAELVSKYDTYTNGQEANFVLLNAREVADDKGNKLKDAKGQQLYIVTNQGLSSFNRMFISLENKSSYDMLEEVLHSAANIHSARPGSKNTFGMSPEANKVVDQAHAWFVAKQQELEAKGRKNLSETERDLLDEVKAARIATAPDSKARREFYHKMVGIKFAGYSAEPRAMELQWAPAIVALPVTEISAPLVAQDLKGMFGPGYAGILSREGFTMSIPEHAGATPAPNANAPQPVAVDSVLANFPTQPGATPAGESKLEGFGPVAPSVGGANLDIFAPNAQDIADGFSEGPWVHRTNSAYDAFDPEKSAGKASGALSMGAGVYFATKDYGTAYGERRIVAVARLKNPLRISSLSEFKAAADWDSLFVPAAKVPDGSAFGAQAAADTLAHNTAMVAATKRLQAKGYDGVIYTTKSGEILPVVFNPADIRVKDDSSGLMGVAPSVGGTINPTPSQPREEKFRGGPEKPFRMPTAEQLEQAVKSKFSLKMDRLNREELEQTLSDALDTFFDVGEESSEETEESTDADTAMNDAANSDAFARQQRSQFAPVVEALGKRIQELNGGSALPVDAASSLTVVLQDLKPVLDPILMSEMPEDQQSTKMQEVLNDYRELGPQSAMADLLHNAVISTLSQQLSEGKMKVTTDGVVPGIVQLYNYYSRFQVLPAVTITFGKDQTSGMPTVRSYIKNLTDPENGVLSFIHSRIDRMIASEGGAVAVVRKFQNFLLPAWQKKTTTSTTDSQAKLDAAEAMLRELVGLPDYVFANAVRPLPGAPGRTPLSGFVYGAALEKLFKQLSLRAPENMPSTIKGATPEQAAAEFLHKVMVDTLAQSGKSGAFSFLREMISKTSYDALSLALRHRSEADGASQKDNIQGAVMLQGIERLAKKAGVSKESMLMKLADIRNDSGQALNGTQAVLYPGVLATVEDFMWKTFRNQDGTFGGWVSLPTFGENDQVFFVRAGKLSVDEAKKAYTEFYEKTQDAVVKKAMIAPADVTDNKVFLKFAVSQTVFGSIENYVEQKKKKLLENLFKRLKQLSTPGLGFNRDLNIYFDASKKWGKKFDGQWIFFPKASADFAKFFHGGQSTGHMKAHIYDVQDAGPVRLVKVNGMNLTVLSPESGAQGLPNGETWDGSYAIVPEALINDLEGLEDRGELFRSLYKIAQANPKLDGIVFGDSGQKLGETQFGAALSDNGGLSGDFANQLVAGTKVIPKSGFVMSQDLSDETNPRLDRFARQGFWNQFGLPQSGLRAQLFQEMQLDLVNELGYAIKDDAILKQKAEGGDAAAQRLLELLNAGVSPQSVLIADKVQQRRMAMLNRLMEHASYRVRSVMSGNGDAAALTPMQIVDGKVRLGTMNSSSPGRYALKFESREAAIEAIKTHPAWYADMIDGLDLSKPIDWANFQWTEGMSVREHEFREMTGMDSANRTVTYTVIPGEYNLTDRIPGDFMQSHVPLRLWVRLDPRMNTAMSDDLSQIRKGEDFDGDTMYQNMLVRLDDGAIPTDDSRVGKYNRILLSILQDLREDTAFAFQTSAEEFRDGWISALEKSNPALLAKSENLKLFTFETEDFFRNAYISGRKVLGVVARFNNMVGMFPELDISFGTEMDFAVGGRKIKLSLKRGDIPRSDKWSAKEYEHLARFKQWVGTGLVNVAVDDPKKPRLYLAGLTGDSIGLLQAFLLGRYAEFATEAGARQAVQDAVDFMRSKTVIDYLKLSGQADYRNPMLDQTLSQDLLWKNHAGLGNDSAPLKALVEIKEALRKLSGNLILATPGNKFADVRAFQKAEQMFAEFAPGTGEALSLGSFSPSAEYVRNMGREFLANAGSIFDGDIALSKTFAKIETMAARRYGADRTLSLSDRTPVSSRAFGLMHSRAGQASLIQGLHDPRFVIPNDEETARAILSALVNQAPGNKFLQALTYQASSSGMPRFIVQDVRTDYLNPDYVAAMRAEFAQLPSRVKQYVGYLAAVWYGTTEGTRLGNFTVLFDDAFQKLRGDAQTRVAREWATADRDIPETLIDYLTLNAFPYYKPAASATDHSRLLAMNSSAAQAEKRTKLLRAITRVTNELKTARKDEAKAELQELLNELRALEKATSANRMPMSDTVRPAQIAAMLDPTFDPQRLAAEAAPGPQSKIEPPPVIIPPPGPLPVPVSDVFARLPKNLQGLAEDFGIWPTGDVLGVDEADAVAKAAELIRNSGIDEANKQAMLAALGVAKPAAPQTSTPIKFVASKAPGYPSRTFANAAMADVTIDFSMAPIGSGGTRGLTRIAAEKAGKVYINVPVSDSGFDPAVAAKIITNAVKRASLKVLAVTGPFSVNFAGHELGKMSIPQAEIDRLVEQTLRMVQFELSASQGNVIKSVRSGGQTGFDEAGIKAGVVLGVPTEILAPRDWNYRPAQTDVIGDEAGFKARFGVQKPATPPSPTPPTTPPAPQASRTLRAERPGYATFTFNVDPQGNVSNVQGMRVNLKTFTPAVQKTWEAAGWKITDASIGKFTAGLALGAALSLGTNVASADDSIDIGAVRNTISANETAPVGSPKRLHPYLDRGHWAIGPGIRLTPENWMYLKPILGGTRASWQSDKKTITEDQLAKITTIASMRAADFARKNIPGYGEMDPQAQTAIADLIHWSVYPNKFPKSWEALKRGDVREAVRQLELNAAGTGPSKAMLDSLQAPRLQRAIDGLGGQIEAAPADSAVETSASIIGANANEIDVIARSMERAKMLKDRVVGDGSAGWAVAADASVGAKRDIPEQEMATAKRLFGHGRGAIGLVLSDGSVLIEPNTTGASHQSVFNRLDGARFHLRPSGLVTWTGTPDLDAKFAVENWVARTLPALSSRIDHRGWVGESVADASIGPRYEALKAAIPGRSEAWYDLASKLPNNPKMARQLADLLNPGMPDEEFKEMFEAAAAVPARDVRTTSDILKQNDGGMRAYLNGRFSAKSGDTNYDLSRLAVAIEERKLKVSKLDGKQAQEAQIKFQSVLNNIFQIGDPAQQAAAVIKFTEAIAKADPKLRNPMATLRAHIAQFLIERDHGWTPGELWVDVGGEHRSDPEIGRLSASIAGFATQDDMFVDPFLHGGNLSMHQALLKGMREINALKQEAVRYVMMKKKLYADTPDRKVFKVEDAEGFDIGNDIDALRGTSKKYRRFLDDRIGGLFKKGRRVEVATLTEDQAFDVQMFLWAAGAMQEHATHANPASVAQIPVQKNVLPARLQALVREQSRPQTEDEILLQVPPPPKAEFIAAQDIINLWNASEAKRILASAGRTEQELDPLALAKEMKEKFDTTRERVNQVLANTFRDQPYLRYRMNYMPHVFGNGLLGPEVRAIELQLESAVRNADKNEVARWQNHFHYVFDPKNTAVMRDPAPELIYEVLKRERFRGLAALSPTDPTLVTRMQAGEFVKWGLEPGFTYANVSLHLKRSVENELIATALGRKPWEDPSAASSPTPVDQLSKTDIALLHHLRTAVGNFKAREFSNRAYARSYDTYMDAWLSRYWLPKSMSPVENYHRYAMDVYTTALNKSLLSKFILQRDVDGVPIVVPRVSRVYREEGVVPKEVWRELLQNLSTAYGKPVDLNGDVGAQINAIIDEFIEPKKGRDWIEVESNFSSIVKFHVQKTGGGVLEDLVGGEAAGILKHLVEQKAHWYVGDYDVLKGLTHTNAWMKSNSVGFSLFFPFSTGESVIAGTGLKKNILYYNTKTGYSAPFGRAFKENIREMLQLREMMRNNAPQMSEFANFMERTGLSFDFANVSEGVVGTVEADIEAMAKRVELAMGPKAAANFKKVVGANNQWSRTLFGDLFPTIKVWATHRIFMQMKHENPNVTDTEIMKAIAPMMDAAYGGIEWERFAWATPRVVQYLNLSLFAPIWTFAAWNIAGGGLLTGRILKNYMSPEFRKFVFTQNWPAMMALVLFGIPNAIQAVIWAAAGGPDDSPLASLNEDGKGGIFPSIDLTPLVRHSPLYTGEKTGKRRVYARFGKQSFEVLDGWLKEPLNTFLRKLSQPAKLVFEQVTGTSPGSEWNLEFRGRGMLGWVEDKNGEFLGSRAGYALQKFLPMSLVQAVKNPATLPTNFIVPTSKGMSLGTAAHILEQIMWTYANEDTWSLVKVKPEYQTRLAALAPEVLDATERNGVNPDKVISTAKGAVLGKLYGEFYEALNQNDTKALERISYRILRVNGSLDGIQRSVKNRDSQFGRTDTRTPEQQEAIAAAFK